MKPSLAEMHRPALEFSIHVTRTRTNLVVWLACLSVVLLTAPSARAQRELPTDRLLKSLEPTADVNDFADILTPAEENALEDRCRALREKTGAQLAVVTLKSLQGGQIDDFSVKLFKRWGVGRKDERDGVLLLVAIEDRKARIEVGYGLEPILPDALAGRILTEQLFPAFKQEKYAQGLQAAVERIISIVEKNEPAKVNQQRPAGEAGPWVIVGFLALFVAVGAFMLGATIAKSEFRVVPFAALFIVFPILIGLCLAFPLAPIVHIPLGFLLTWFGYHAMQDHHRGPRGRRRARSWDWGPGTSTWNWGPSVSSSGWSGGGFSSGGGSSWGGFSGGSSGGGGASGGW
jgi:uncharacterized protein